LIGRKEWKIKMKPFERCPVCGGELENKLVEKLLRGGDNIVSVKVSAEVCEIRDKLCKQEFSRFKILGQSFTVEETWPNKAIQPT
jgi:YgiT-type zinc finger domain-containing protein